MRRNPMRGPGGTDDNHHRARLHGRGVSGVGDDDCDLSFDS